MSTETMSNVTLRWLVYRSGLGSLEEYGVPYNLENEHPSVISETQDMIRLCHSDSDPAPPEPQYYLWRLSTHQWALMQSIVNREFEQAGVRHGRVYVILVMTDTELLLAVPDGDPVKLIELVGTERDLFGLALRRQEENKRSPIILTAAGPSAEPTRRRPDRPLPFASNGSQAETRKSLLNWVSQACRDGYTPPSFATWWSYTRPQSPGRFDALLLSPRPAPFTTREAVSAAGRLSESLMARMVVPAGLDSYSQEIVRDVQSAASQLPKDIQALALRTGEVTSEGWSDELTRLSGTAIEISSRLKAYIQRIESQLDPNGRAAMDAVAREYRTFAPRLKDTRQPAGMRGATAAAAEATTNVATADALKRRDPEERLTKPRLPRLSTPILAAGVAVIVAGLGLGAMAVMKIASARKAPGKLPVSQSKNEEALNAEIRRALAGDARAKGEIHAVAKEAAHRAGARAGSGKYHDDARAAGRRAGEKAGREAGEAKGEILGGALGKSVAQKMAPRLFAGNATATELTRLAMDSGESFGAQLGKKMGTELGERIGADEGASAGDNAGMDRPSPPVDSAENPGRRSERPERRDPGTASRPPKRAPEGNSPRNTADPGRSFDDAPKKRTPEKHPKQNGAPKSGEREF